MRTAQNILIDLGIDARRFNVGAQSCKCPKCSHTRKKKNARCLAVKIDNDGVTWFCHHCGERGGEYYESEKEWKPNIPVRKVLSVSAMRGIRNATR